MVIVMILFVVFMVATIILFEKNEDKAAKIRWLTEERDLRERLLRSYEIQEESQE